MYKFFILSNGAREDQLQQHLTYGIDRYLLIQRQLSLNAKRWQWVVINRGNANQLSAA